MNERCFSASTTERRSARCVICPRSASASARICVQCALKASGDIINYRTGRSQPASRELVRLVRPRARRNLSPMRESVGGNQDFICETPRGVVVQTRSLPKQQLRAHDHPGQRAFKIVRQSGGNLNLLLLLWIPFCPARNSGRGKMVPSQELRAGVTGRIPPGTRAETAPFRQRGHGWRRAFAGAVEPTRDFGQLRWKAGGGYGNDWRQLQRMNFTEPPSTVRPSISRHAQVQQNEVRFGLAGHFNRLPAIARHQQPMMGAGQHGLEQPAIGLVVIDTEHRGWPQSVEICCHRRHGLFRGWEAGRTETSGNRSWKTDPRFSSLVTITEPPIFSASRLTMASPSPVPWRSFGMRPRLNKRIENRFPVGP